MAKSGGKSKEGEALKIVARNRRASYDYELTDRLECGIVLVGTEVKSLREGHCVLEAAYAKITNGEIWLVGAEIPEYTMGNRMNHLPKRERKLLAHRREIAKFAGAAAVRGLTLVPLAVYFKDGRAKVEIAVAKGKQTQDKRQSLKQTEAKREIERAMSRRHR